jgi:hypothetical protein
MASFVYEPPALVVLGSVAELTECESYCSVCPGCYQ